MGTATQHPLPLSLIRALVYELPVNMFHELAMGALVLSDNAHFLFLIIVMFIAFRTKPQEMPLK